MLVRMLGTGRDSVHAAAAARCLADLVRAVPRLQRRAAAAGASEALLFLTAGGAATAAAAAAAGALAALCEGEPSPSRAVCAGGGTALLARLLPSCGDAAAEAATALSALTAADPDAAAEAPALLPQLLLGAAAPPAAPASRCRCAVASAAAASRLLRAWPEHADGLVPDLEGLHIATALHRCAAAAAGSTAAHACVWRISFGSPSQPTSPHGASIPALHSLGSLYGTESSDKDLLVELKLVPDPSAATAPPCSSSAAPPGSGANVSTGTLYQPHVLRPGQAAADALTVYSDSAACRGPDPAIPPLPSATTMHGAEASGVLSAPAPAKAVASMRLEMAPPVDAGAALEVGWLQVAELAASVCDASPALQAALRDAGAVEAVVRLPRALLAL